MMQYIKKATIIEEIWRRKAGWHDGDIAVVRDKIKELDEILDFIDNLEVKEVEEVPAEVRINSYGNKYISTWSGLNEYNNYRTGEQIKVLISKR